MFLTVPTERTAVCVCVCVCVRARTHSLPALVVAASLQRDLDDLVPHAHVELAAAVQDQQAPDGLPLPGREQLDLLQQATPGGMIEGGKHLPDGAVLWEGRSRWMEERKSMGGCYLTINSDAVGREVNGGDTQGETNKNTSICISLVAMVNFSTPSELQTLLN